MEIVDVVVPENSEGTEATVLRWCFKVGDQVGQHQPLLELETDKVTVEVPAPETGELVEILKNERDAVQPGAILARLRKGAGAAAATGPATAKTASAAPATAPSDQSRSQLQSPAVRRLLAENALDPDAIPSSGKDGRLTAQDITRFLESGAAVTAARPAARPTPTKLTGRKVPHSAMRKRIAAHMVESMATAPHVSTIFQVDMGRVLKHRERHQEAFARDGIKLTLTAYFVAASAQALAANPEVNASFHADFLQIHGDCNVGVGTALGSEGLIVPVIHRADTLDLRQTARRLGELVAAARENRLKPEDVRAGTFTISNHGVSGSILAAPIVINQPQVAILGVGKLERRVIADEVDGEEIFRVRSMCYLTLTIDHRALDGYQANTFLAHVVKTLESWPLD
ncbi:MAG TPA: 2-oxo acid dehydrogenase subunit E2 [Steroidobacteraceae bacterium]|nr:2-oxo acid dehydrogenase subunit E2 [Steroidobacteraceae bacterium]